MSFELKRNIKEGEDMRIELSNIVVYAHSSLWYHRT